MKKEWSEPSLSKMPVSKTEAALKPSMNNDGMIYDITIHLRPGDSSGDIDTKLEGFS